MPTPTISLRLAAPDDRPFLCRLFSAGRVDDFATLGESAASNLLASQFEIQQNSYVERFGLDSDLVITVGDEPVGRLFVHCDSTDWTLVDIAVLPTHRNTGIASTLLRDLVRQAGDNEATVRLNVRLDNLGAQRLYFRLGFTADGVDDMDLQLVLRPMTRRIAQFEAFRRLVLGDPGLQQQLRALRRDAFVDGLIGVARAHGFEFEPCDVNRAVRYARTEWLSRWV